VYLPSQITQKYYQKTTSDKVDAIYDMVIPCSVIDALCQDDQAVTVLECLEIDPDDQYYLSDVVDPDHNGSVKVIEIVEGITKLRGEPRKSDMICLDLMLRSIQVSLLEFTNLMKEIGH